MSSVVLDASAILAVARNERGADVVKSARVDAILSTVNQMEVVSKLLQHDLPLEEIQRFLTEAFPRVIAFDQHHSDRAAQLHAANRAHHLSYADCACLALAMERGLPVLTGDRKWAMLTVNIEIKLFR